MLSDEEKEIFNNLKEYMQSNIDNGYHKFIYNDLDWDFKCIDCINAIDNALKQSKEIEELKEQCKEVVCIPEGTCFMLEPKDVDKKWKDKIKAKIEELKLIADNGANAVRFAMTHDDEVERIQKQKDISAMIDILQSLLEKE